MTGRKLSEFNAVICVNLCEVRMSVVLGFFPLQITLEDFSIVKILYRISVETTDMVNSCSFCLQIAWFLILQLPGFHNWNDSFVSGQVWVYTAVYFHVQLVITFSYMTYAYSLSWYLFVQKTTFTYYRWDRQRQTLLLKQKLQLISNEFIKVFVI